MTMLSKAKRLNFITSLSVYISALTGIPGYCLQLRYLLIHCSALLVGMLVYMEVASVVNRHAPGGSQSSCSFFFSLNVSSK